MVPLRLDESTVGVVHAIRGRDSLEAKASRLGAEKTVIFYRFVRNQKKGVMSKAIHQGRNVKRFREMLGLKQEGLAYELGEEWSQKRVSLLEQKEVIEQELLEQVAQVLKVPAEAIKNFDEETAIYNIQNNYEGSHNQGANNLNYNCTFNPLDKMVELYERLLESEKEKVTLLKELLSQIK